MAIMEQMMQMLVQQKQLLQQWLQQSAQRLGEVARAAHVRSSGVGGDKRGFKDEAFQPIRGRLERALHRGHRR